MARQLARHLSSDSHPSGSGAQPSGSGTQLSGSGTQPSGSVARRLSTEDSIVHRELPLETTPTSHPPQHITTPASSYDQEENVYSTHVPSSDVSRPLLELDEYG